MDQNITKILFFTTFTNLIFGLPLTLFHILNLNQLTPFFFFLQKKKKKLTLFHWCINHYLLDMNKPSQMTFSHIFINMSYPYF